MNCPYCGKEAEWCENSRIYGKNYGASYMCYFCEPCNAYVGCHQNTRKPLGTMANKELREMRIKAHGNIDWLYKTGRIKRHNLYKRLTEHFGRPIHIGESDLETAKAIAQMDPKTLLSPLI